MHSGGDDHKFSVGAGSGEHERVHVGHVELGHAAHVCAFFGDRDEEYRVLLPFIEEGLARGEKACHTLDPARREDHLARLASAGLDVGALRRSGQLELRDWGNTHLRGGRFDGPSTLELFGEVVSKADRDGYGLIRFVTHMEWALESGVDLDTLLEYEAKANEIWMSQPGPIHPVICCYDVRRFGGDAVIEVMRTHPKVIVGGVLLENPFFVPPEEYIRTLRNKRSGPLG